MTKTVRLVPWPSWLRHRANNAGISGSIPLGTNFYTITEYKIYSLDDTLRSRPCLGVLVQVPVAVKDRTLLEKSTLF